MTPLRVLVAHNVPRARTGGMSRIMGFIHDQLTSRGISTDYFCADDVPRLLRGARTRVTFPGLVWRRAAAAARAGRGYDILNVHEPHAALAASWRAHGAAVVVTSHGVEQRGWDIALASEPKPRRLTRLLYPSTSLVQSRIGLTRADHVLCLSRVDAEYLSTRFGIPASRVTRIFPGADPMFADAASPRSYERADTLAFSGSWVPRKGIDALRQAMTSLHDAGKRVRLVVLGAGVSEQEVQWAFRPELRPFVRAVPVMDDAAAAQELARADVFVLPSRFEGTPLTLIEAMMSGLPVVTTAESGMRDVIEDGATGILVPADAPDQLARALDAVLGSQSLRASLGTAARRAALARFSWEAAAAPVEEVYRGLSRRQT